jgi:hypothetical protein
MKKYIRIWVILKRVTDKIRSGCGPLINGTAKNWGNFGFWSELERNFWLDFWETSSEKGCSRKTTENRVTRWRKLFWGNLENPRWFTKRMFSGEIKFTLFWGCGRESTWVYWGGGTELCVWGEFVGDFGGVYSKNNRYWWGVTLRTAGTGELFTLRTAGTGELFTLRTAGTGEGFS